MSDKNRVITNGLFRKKMAELRGEEPNGTPQFNDFQALDVTTFTRELDKLISAGGVKVVKFSYSVASGVQSMISEEDAADIFAMIEKGNIAVALAEYQEGVYSQGFIDLISASTISVRLYGESDMYHATGSVDDNGKYKITIGS